MSETLTTEFPFVEELPKREQTKFSRFVDRWNEFKALTAEHGVLVPVNLASKLAGVSKQRIYQLFEAGILMSVKFEDRLYIPEDKLLAWLQTERSPGTRYRNLTMAECLDLAREQVRESRTKKTSK